MTDTCVPIQGVIFDLDGTLVDSVPAIAAAGNAVLQSGGFPTHPEEAFVGFIGSGIVKTIRRALPEGVSEETVNQVVLDYKLVYAHVWQINTRVYDGIRELLKYLIDADIQLAILTNKIHEDALDHAARLFPEIDPDFVFGEREGVPIKPDPAAALHICRKMRLPPSSCLMLGDMREDLETGLAAGMQTGFAAWGYGEPNLDPAVVSLASPAEVQEYITSAM